ncbi:class I SAM-dependent methyltransferase [Thiocystis violacea]|uniref:class I SAM-dependent methyltransferase n=1 Tax=Thiocystis violacea TaxID=13725 RepID=UPI0019088D46|nr:methyltransferase domain-containing protein [Thiocystis violacea]MBK1719394.1 SAM-dependent methyltransferase [Thiocystis violacea]
MTVDPTQAPKPAPFQDWYRTPLGAAVARIECACVQRLLANTFGYYLVQVGASDGFREALASSRIRHRILLPGEPFDGRGQSGIVGLPTALPLASDSIDALLLPHTLDDSDHPRAVLGEAERVLIPEGRLVIVGFNALSLWGLARLWWPARRRLPWRARFRLASQVEHWLSDLGFDIEAREYALFCPPWGSPLRPRCVSLDALGRRFWPMLGGIYVIRAVKRVATLTPLRPYRTSRRALLPGRAVRPTTRGTGHA